MPTTVLLVDDEKHVVNVVGHMLEQRNFEVVSADSGEEALALLEEGLIPDLALLDIILPGIDGATLAQQMRGLPATEDVPIIFLTGLIEAGEIHRGGNQIGGQYFLAKPFDSTELFAVIERAMSED